MIVIELCVDIHKMRAYYLNVEINLLEETRI